MEGAGGRRGDADERGPKQQLEVFGQGQLDVGSWRAGHLGRDVEGEAERIAVATEGAAELELDRGMQAFAWKLEVDAGDAVDGDGGAEDPVAGGAELRAWGVSRVGRLPAGHCRSEGSEWPARAGVSEDQERALHESSLSALFGDEVEESGLAGCDGDVDAGAGEGGLEALAEAGEVAALGEDEDRAVAPLPGELVGGCLDAGEAGGAPTAGL